MLHDSFTRISPLYTYRTTIKKLMWINKIRMHCAVMIYIHSIFKVKVSKKIITKREILLNLF